MQPPPCTPLPPQEHASNSAVVVEYLRALVASGRLSEYAAPPAASSSSFAGGLAAGLAGRSAAAVAAGGSGSAATSSSSSGSVLVAEDHRSLTQLLRDLQLQVWGGCAGWEGVDQRGGVGHEGSVKRGKGQDAAGDHVGSINVEEG